MINFPLKTTKDEQATLRSEGFGIVFFMVFMDNTYLFSWALSQNKFTYCLSNHQN